jgi:hypothetical protein
LQSGDFVVCLRAKALRRAAPKLAVKRCERRREDAGKDRQRAPNSRRRSPVLVRMYTGALPAAMVRSETITGVSPRLFFTLN